MAVLHVIFEKQVQCFTGVPKLEKTDESVYCFRVFGEFLKWLLNQRLITIKGHFSHKHEIFAFFCLISAQFVM